MSLMRFPALLSGVLAFASIMLVFGTTNHQPLLSGEPPRPECIAPAKPGGGFDLTCKLIQSALQDAKSLQAPMRVTYMPGGVGAVAYNAMTTHRNNDVNSIVAFSGGSLLNITQGKFGHLNEDDVRWLATIGVDYGVIAVSVDSKIKNLTELMTILKTHPEKVVFGAGASIGSQDWMKAALIAEQAGVNYKTIRYVPFEGGGEAFTALMGGHVQVVSGDLGEAEPYYLAGKIRILAILADERLTGQLADVPTAKEQGINLTWPVIRGFYMGPDVDDHTFSWWENTLNTALQTPEFAALRRQRGLYPYTLTGIALQQEIKKQTQFYREYAQSFDLIKN